MSFIRCPRKYFYEKCGVTSKDEATALVYGSAMHKAVPHLFTKGGIEAAIPAFQSVWDESLTDSKHSTQRAIAQLSHFAHTHTTDRSLYWLEQPPPNPGITLADDVNDFEIPFVLDVGLRVPIAGRIDGWCRHQDGSLWAWELKTSGRLTSSMFDSLEFNPQLLTYALVCSTFTKEKIRGVMFEVILKDAKKVDNMSHPVPVQDHHLQDIALWLRYWGELLLACEDRCEDIRLRNEQAGSDLRSTVGGGMEDIAKAFPKNFAGCSAYPLFYQTGSVCDFVSLCRTPEWKSLLEYYDIKPEHNLIELTRGAT
jgi:hypothetical protein